jgi:hypothetical protein
VRNRFCLLSTLWISSFILFSLPSPAQTRGERSTIRARAVSVDFARAAKLPPKRHIESDEEEEEERDADIMLSDDTPPAEIERLRNRKLEPGEGGGVPIVDQTDILGRGKGRKIQAAPTLGRNFTGVSNTGWYPPDPSLAASADYVVEAANASIRVMNKAGTLLNQVTLANFFAGVTPPNFIYDPKVVYDPDRDRFVVLVLALDNATQIGYYLVAASRTGNPTGQWWSYKLNARLDGNTNTTNWPDYPGLGFDGEAVYLTSNQYTLANNIFSYSKIRILDKNVLYAGGNLNWFDFTNMRNSDNTLVFTIKPAVTYGAAGGEYLLNTRPNGASYVTLWQVTNPIAPTPTLTRQGGRTNVGAYAFPANTAQLGACPNLDAGDCRTQDVVWRDGTLYAGFCEGHNWGGGTVSSVRLLKIATATATATQDYTFGQNNVHYFYPNVTADACGRMYIVCQKSSSAIFTEVHCVVDPWSDPTTTLIKAGTACYNIVNQNEPRNRWGDYSGICADPSSGVWAVGEVATAANQWNTWIGEITSAGTTLAAVAGRDTSVCAGGSATITVTPSGGTAPYTYLWTPATGLSSAAVQSPVATPAGTTPYHVDVTDACGSVVSATVTVTINPPPTPAIAGLQSACTGAMVPYTTTYAAGHGFAWSVTGGSIVGRADSSTVIVQWGPAGAGTLTLTETVTATGCRTTTAPYAVTINPPPAPAIAGLQSVCADAAATYTTLYVPGHRYLWTVTGGTIAGRADSNIVTVSWGGSGNGTLRVAETITATGCSQTTAPYSVTINAPPTADAGAPIDICLGSTVTIGPSFPPTDGLPPYDYLWTPATGLSSPSLARPDASPTVTTLYHLRVTDARGCGSIDSVLVTVNTLDRPTVSPSRQPVLCDGESVILSADGGYDSYLWSTGETTQSIEVRGAGAYAVTVGKHGCLRTSDSFAVVMSPKPAPVVQGPVSVCPGSSAPYVTHADAPQSYQWVVNGGTIISGQGTPTISVKWGGTGSGRVSVIATNNNGCSGEGGADVSVTNQIAPPVLSPDATIDICQGDKATISAPAGYASYLWTNGATTQSIIVDSAGSYGVRVSDSGGCSNSSLPVSVVVHPLPAKPVVVRDPKLNQLYAIGAGGSGYRWSRNDTLIAGATGDTLVTSIDGRYAVTLIDANGCTATSDPYDVKWVTPNSVAIETGGDGMVVRPNPTSGVFTIELNAGVSAPVTIVLTGLDGKEVRRINYGKATGPYRAEVDIRDLPSGVYILELQAGERKWARKVVKQ